jgi:hypothetical protein
MPGSLPAQSQKMYSSQPELNSNWTKVSYKRGRLTQEETEKPNTPKRVNTGSTKLALPIATQLYWKRKVKTDSRKPILRTRQNLLQSI